MQSFKKIFLKIRSAFHVRNADLVKSYAVKILKQSCRGILQVVAVLNEPTMPAHS